VRRLLGVLALALALLPAAASAAERPRFDTKVFALIPRPGFPAMAYAAPNGRVYEGTYDNPSGDSMPSRVLEYLGDGTLLRSWTILGQDLSAAHGVQVATMGPSGRLFLLDKAPPRVIKLDRRTGAQKDYARFPAGAVPNYAAWGPDGSMYVTDYHGGVLWRVPKGGGEPVRWLEDPALDGGEFGTTGIVLDADRRTLVVGQQSTAGLGVLSNPSTGKLYRVEIEPDGTPGPVQTLWESRPLDGPDGFAIARSGAIYVANLLSNQLVVVGPDGAERERFPSAPTTGENGSPVPFDAPSSVRFLGTRLVIANQAFSSGDATHQAILDVEAGEEGLPEFVPAAEKRAKPKPKPRKAKRKRKR
jgi:sugar lactone lactonase YvrE